MNILFINSARSWGGTEKWTRMAAESLADNDSNKVCLVYRKNIVGNTFTITKYRLPCVSHIDMYSLVRIIQIIKKENIEILVPTKRKDYVLAGIASKLCGTGNVLRLGIARRLKIPVFHKLVYHTLADGIIVNAKKIKDELMLSRFMDNGKIRVIYNGLDTENIDRMSRPPAEKPYAFTITAAGALTSRKGFDFLIRGFSRFLVLLPGVDAGLVIMGDGAEKKTFRALAEALNIDDRVEFTGFLQNPFPHLASSDVFAMTSTNEGIPNALLEAMYLGNAPVSTRAGGSAEAICNGENGFLLDYGDEEKLAEVLIELYRNPDLRDKIAARAAERVIEQFSTHAMEKGITAFLGDTLSKKS